MSLDAKSAFLVEAIFATAGSAINEIGSRLNGLVDLVSESANAMSADLADEETEEAADESAGESESKADGKKKK